MNATPGKDAVLEAHASNRAITSLLTSLPDSILDAKFDRNELTLSIARDQIRAACSTVQAGGYNILSHSLKERIRLIAFVDTVDPSIDSITPVWPSANFYEREVFDLFGVRFHGHPNLRRIMMPDEWEGHPLRKDYPVEGYR
jgi:NADH-quinone oxidoreductase subunit C